MHSISLILIGVLLVICPYVRATTTTETTELEEPKILPLTDALKTSSADETKSPFKREVWQEDDREVLIRNERGTKDNGSGSTSGKKQKHDNSKNNKDKKDPNKHALKQQQQHLNKTPDTNSESTINTTQETVKKHQHHQQKHEKNGNNKKHASTEKPKHKDESKRN